MENALLIVPMDSGLILRPPVVLQLALLLSPTKMIRQVIIFVWLLAQHPTDLLIWLRINALKHVLQENTETIQEHVSMNVGVLCGD